MSDRHATWNVRFAERPDVPLEPEPWVVRHLARVRAGGAVLDLACGDGRNALHAAARGFRVVGVDFAERGLERLVRFAGRAGLAVETRRVDLEAAGALDGLGPFDGVVVCHYKPTPALWAAIPGVLAPGGVVLAVTFNEEEHAASGFPARFCVAPGEWRRLPGLAVVDEQRFVEGDRHLDGYVLTRA